MDRAAYQQRYRQEYKAHAKRVNLTLTASEYRSIARAASASGVPVATLVKRLALQNASLVSRELPPALGKQLADLDHVIRSIANNVNQMARFSHRIAQVLDEQELFLHIRALQDELKTAIERAADGRAPGHSATSSGHVP